MAFEDGIGTDWLKVYIGGGSDFFLIDEIGDTLEDMVLLYHILGFIH